MRTLTSFVPEVKLTIKHTPTHGEKISDGLKKHYSEKKRLVKLTDRQARKLASKWGAKYHNVEGK